MALGSRLIWCAKNLLKFVREHLIYLKGAKRFNSRMFCEKNVDQKFFMQRAKHCINKQLAIKKKFRRKNILLWVSWERFQSLIPKVLNRFRHFICYLRIVGI